MLDCVEKYFEITTAADAEYVAAQRKAMSDLRAGNSRDGYGDPYRPVSARIAYNMAMDMVLAAQRTAQARARELLQNSGDPLVAFIASHCMEEHASEAEAVLRILPASLSRIREVARDHGWCGDFDRYVIDALQGGVIVSDRSTAREEFVIWVRENTGSDYVDAGLELVDAILDAEAQTHLARRYRERKELREVPHPNQGSTCVQDLPPLSKQF